MDDDVSQTGNALQAGWLIEVGQHGSGTVFAPEGALPGSRNQREDAVMAKQTGQQRRQYHRSRRSIVFALRNFTGLGHQRRVHGFSGQCSAEPAQFSRRA
jgi:hypothetical protein